MDWYFAKVGCCAALLVALTMEPSQGDQKAVTAVAKPTVSEVSVSTPVVTESPAKKKLFQHTSYPEAWKAAQKTNRPILIYVCMPNCPHCVKMKEKTYELPHIEKMVEGSFETLHVGRYKNAALVSKLKIKWFPTTVLVSPNNKVLDKIEGYVDDKKFQQRLQTGLASMPRTVKTR